IISEMNRMLRRRGNNAIKAVANAKYPDIVSGGTIASSRATTSGGSGVLGVPYWRVILRADGEWSLSEGLRSSGRTRRLGLTMQSSARRKGTWHYAVQTA